MKDNIAAKYQKGVNTTSKLNEMNKKAKHLQKIGIKINSFPSVFLTSEWENHAPCMVSPSQAFPNITNNLLKNTMDQIDFKYFDHDAEQQDMTASCMMVLSSMVNDENRSLMQQLTINPATDEELKYQSLITFFENTFPPHFYQWRKKVLNLIQGIPLTSQDFYIMTFLEGEAKYRVKTELAYSSSPNKEQVLEVLENHYGDNEETGCWPQEPWQDPITWGELGTCALPS